MAGFVPNIEPGSITEITGLKRRPVYFLTLGFSATPNLVVKGERPGDDSGSDDDVKLSVHWTSKLMKNVNSKQFNTRPLSADEYNYFQHAVNVSSGVGIPQRDNLAVRYNWVKMPYVAGLSDAGYNEAKSNEQTTIIKKCLKICSIPMPGNNSAAWWQSMFLTRTMTGLISKPAIGLTKEL